MSCALLDGRKRTTPDTLKEEILGLLRTRECEITQAIHKHMKERGVIFNDEMIRAILRDLITLTDYSQALLCVYF